MAPKHLIFLGTAFLASQAWIAFNSPTRAFDASSADNAKTFLRSTQDKYHQTFNVYTDQDEAGNHFTPSGWMTERRTRVYDPAKQLTYRGDWQQNPRSGKTCIRITTTFATGGAPWAGIYWLYPDTNWGKIPNVGYNLTNADSLVLFARGENGGERVDFFTLGAGLDAEFGGRIEPYPDSSPRVPPLFTRHQTLNKAWTRYAISVRGLNLTYVIGGFAFAVDRALNRGQDITFYLDDIYFVLGTNARQKRLEESRLLLSYVVADYKEDFAIRNAAFTNDNAGAMWAFMAETTNLQSDDWKRAKLIGDAFVGCQNNDRYFKDGRLRNGYQAGDLLDRQTGYARIPGWWEPDSGKWFEIDYAAGTYTGNMAWAIITWLKYNKWKKEPTYVDAAVKLGKWIRDRYDVDERGYRGGFEGFEPNQETVKWLSVEHNILVYAAFAMLHEATGDANWWNWAMDARTWVDSKWQPVPGHFPTPQQINLHALAYLFLGEAYAPGLDWVGDNFFDPCPKGDPFGGFDFNYDRDGIWFEGTAQISCALLTRSRFTKSEKDSTNAMKFLMEIEKAQKMARNHDGFGIVEACHDSVTTGQLDLRRNPVFKNNRLHVGATAWYILAQPRQIRTVVESSLNRRFPASFALVSNYPNPFVERTTIAYALPMASKVSLEIYNMLGQKIKTLVDTKQHAGYYSASWDGKDASNRDVPNGMYFYRIIADSFVQTRKMLIIR